MDKTFYHVEHPEWSLKSELSRIRDRSSLDQTRVAKIKYNAYQERWCCVTKQPIKTDGLGRNTAANTLRAVMKLRNRNGWKFAVQVDLTDAPDPVAESIMVEDAASLMKVHTLYHGKAPVTSSEMYEEYEWFSWRYAAIPLMCWIPHGLHIGGIPYKVDIPLLESAENWPHYKQLLEEKYRGNILQEVHKRKIDIVRQKEKQKSFMYKGYRFYSGKAPAPSSKVFHFRLPPKKFGAKIERQVNKQG